MNLLYSLFASLALNGVFFIFAAYLRTDVFTDITYSLSFVLLTAGLYLFSQNHGAAQIAVSAMVILWGLRLGGYLFNRILRIKVDHRFDDKRDNPVRFGMFWLLQAVTVWVVMLPVYGLLSLPAEIEPPAWALAVSVAVFLAGFLVEAFADAQKYRFKTDEANRGKFMKGGLWAWSRHPNYFGEMLLWWAISFPGLFVFRGPGYLYFLGPLFITLLIRFVSGVPLLEKAAEGKWGDSEEYRAYKKNTPLLIPRPPRRG